MKPMKTWLHLLNRFIAQLFARNPEISRSRKTRGRLKWRTTALAGAIAMVFVFALRLPAAASPAKHYTELTFPPLPELQLPEYERFQLDNGLVVYLMEDHELPLASGMALFRTGDRWEPADRVGLASLTGSVMRTGGTTQHPPDRLNQFLEQRAASVETGIDTASGSASFDALSEDLEEVFKVFAEVIQQPAFAEKQFDLAITQRRGQIARRNDDPNAIATREFRKLIYGDNSPYARTVEYATLDKIDRNDLRAFYQTYIRPDKTILGIVGDFDPQKMRSLIESTFGAWQPSAATPLRQPAKPKVSQAKPDGLFFVDRPQLTQSYVYLGHLGGQLDDPDYPALTVLNNVMNGFGGRLFNEVRSRQGLAYSVFGAWSARYDYPGIFIAGGQTRSDATVPFVNAIQTEIDRLRTTPITSDELAYAKDSTLNSFIFNFQSPDQTLSRLMRYEYYGYPEDFLFQYRKEVEATTAEDVKRVAQSHLQPSQFVTLVVGNKTAIAPPLSTLNKGAPSTIDVTIPGDPSA